MKKLTKWIGSIFTSVLLMAVPIIATLSMVLKNDTFFIALFLVLTLIEFSILTTTIYNNIESKEI